MIKIAIHSVPRSGSSWLGSIFDSSPKVAYRFQPLFSFTHKNQLNENSTFEDINIFFRDIFLTKDHFVLQKKEKENKKIPSFDKKNISHIVYKEVRYHHILENLLDEDLEVKIIGLIRNPFSVISSWLKAPKEFKKELGWKVEEEWRNAPNKNLDKPEEFNGYEKWKEIAFLFLKLQKLYPERFYLLSYEDLLTNRVAEVKKLFKFSGIDYTIQTAQFLNNSSMVNHKDAYSIFKVKTSDTNWKQELPSYITEEIKSDHDFKLLNKEFQWI